VPIGDRSGCGIRSPTFQDCAKPVEHIDENDMLNGAAIRRAPK
jgi:hypothetical protein